MSSTGMSTLLYHILLMCVSLTSGKITCDQINGYETIQNCTLENGSIGILHEFPPHAQSAYSLYANNQRAIYTISSTVFDNFTNLNYLYLNDNSLRTVSERWFKKLEKVKTIDLSGNFITHVDDTAFLLCERISNIDLSRNLIEDFRYRSNDLHNADLYLSKNPLKRIEIGPVDRLHVDETNLTELHLQNEVGHVYASNSRISSFSAPRSLEVLVLSGNNFTNISNIAVLNGLWWLDLSRNNIGTLSPDAFLNLFQLERLNLSQNSISHLYYSLFANQANIYELDLSENKISHFNTNHLRRTRVDKPFEHLYLHNNPINKITDDGILLKNLYALYLGGNSLGLDCQKLLDLKTIYYNNIKVPDYLERFDVDNVGGIGCHDPNKS